MESFKKELIKWINEWKECSVCNYMVREFYSIEPKHNTWKFKEVMCKTCASEELNKD
jgi:hypothetical protein